MTARHTTVDTNLGPITIVADGDAITRLYFERHTRRPGGTSLGTEVPMSGDRLLIEAARQLLDYLDGRRDGFDLPLHATGDEFNHEVWEIITGIPFGQTTTYGAIAERLGGKTLAREVGQAVGANPLCIFIPCHRVVGADGSLTGYAGGLARKRALLQLEEPAAAGQLF